MSVSALHLHRRLLVFENDLLLRLEKLPSMKAERRHELKHNELADWLGERVETLKPHATGIAFGVILLFVSSSAESGISAAKIRLRLRPGAIISRP